MSSPAVHPVADLFPAMHAEEYAALVADVRTNGLLEPIWLHPDGRVIDGRHRQRACEEAGITPEYRTWAGTGSLVAFVVSLNLHRRHLDISQRAMVGARMLPMFAEEAKARQRQAGEQHGRGQVVANLPEAMPEGSRAREDAAAAVQVSPRTIESAARVIEQGAPELVAAVDAGEVAVSAAAEVAALPRDTQAAIVEQGPFAVKEAAADIREGRVPHVAQNTGDNEWYTPAEYIAAARAVLGDIDLDPASHPDANAVVEAFAFFTAEDDGLAQPWAGRVWMNPPYASDLIGKFAAKLTDHFRAGDVREAIVLVNNGTETRWFQGLAEYASACCFPRGRVKFWHPRKEAVPLQGQAILYLGDNADAFAERFRAFGMVCHVV
jgi:ParB family chromosome partitioning protein